MHSNHPFHFNLVAAAHAAMIEHGFQPDFPAGTDTELAAIQAQPAVPPPTASPTCATCSGPPSTTTPQKISTRSSGPSSCPTAAFACWSAWPTSMRASTRAPSSTPTRKARPPRSTPASRSFPCCPPSSPRASPRSTRTKIASAIVVEFTVDAAGNRLRRQGLSRAGAQSRATGLPQRGRMA